MNDVYQLMCSHICDVAALGRERVADAWCVLSICPRLNSLFSHALSYIWMYCMFGWRLATWINVTYRWFANACLQRKSLWLLEIGSHLQPNPSEYFVILCPLTQFNVVCMIHDSIYNLLFLFKWVLRTTSNPFTVTFWCYFVILEARCQILLNLVREFL